MSGPELNTGTWDPDLYLKFEKERRQPILDLVSEISGLHPERTADLGCGPGNSTVIIKQAFPKADITGIDNSESMLARARKQHPDIDFRLLDAHDLDSGYDLIFSNACIQWIPDHRTLIPELMGKLNDGGTLAVQFPMNGAEPLFQIIAETAEEPKWGISGSYFQQHDLLEPDEYYDVLSECASEFRVWQTIYCHGLPSHQSLIDWVRATRLRPYEDCMDPGLIPEFEHELLEKAEKAYPVHSDGNVLLHYRRFFFTAKK